MQDIERFIKKRTRLGIKPGLERIQLLLQKLNNPEKEVPVIHIAGTNGKGSTLTYMSAILQQAGYTVGTFVSPSPLSIEEQFSINGTAMEASELIEIFRRIQPVVEEMDCTYEYATEFEIMVAVAFLHFHNRVDVAVVEAGMGGRLDSTNIVDPILSIITNIGFDHSAFLGDTLQSIATEKAGIIKAQVPVVSGVEQEESLSIIRKQASERQATLWQLGREFQVKQMSDKEWIYSSEGERLDFQLKMMGVHQGKNASLAIQGAKLLNNQGYSVTNEHIKEGLRKAELSGRFEKVASSPHIVVDGAHNVEGISAFVTTVHHFYPDKDQTVLFSAFQDKPINNMIEQLATHFSDIYTTAFNHPRSMSEEDSPPSTQFVADWKEFISQYVHEANKSSTLFVCGSLHFIAQVKRYIREI